jgi:hypothetical protein
VCRGQAKGGPPTLPIQTRRRPKVRFPRKLPFSGFVALAMHQSTKEGALEEVRLYGIEDLIQHMSRPVMSRNSRSQLQYKHGARRNLMKVM